MRISSGARIGLVVVILCSTLIYAVWLTAHEIIHRVSLPAEKKVVMNNLDRVMTILNHYAEDLQLSCRDWAWWDESHFSHSDKGGYALGKAKDGAFDNLGLEFILFLDRSGEIKTSNLLGKKDLRILGCFSNPTCSGERLISSLDPEGKSGFIRIADSLYLVSANLVYLGDFTGDSVGSLVMARPFDSDMLQKLSQDMRLKIKIVPIPKGTSLKPQSIFNTKNLIIGQHLVWDVNGEPLFFLRIEMKHRILDAGRDAIMVFVVFFVLSCGIALFLGNYFINRKFVSRIKLLISQLSSIRSNESTREQLEINGDDELNELADGINDTLTKLHSEQRRAEAASRVKSEFIANMSHEIRTPMNSILGMVELLRETELNKTQDEYLRIVGSAGKNLLTVINDVLEISKIEAGHLQIEQIEFLLKEMLERVVSLLAVDASKKGLSLTCDISNEIPYRIVGDPTRIRQVLINLISNAIKFTSEGGVELKVGVDRSYSPARLVFSVTDTGIGIIEEKQKLIFESFSQADTTTTRKYGGTGLGLAISCKLITLMGGKLTVNSNPGKGSCFSFYLELKTTHNVHHHDIIA